MARPKAVVDEISNELERPVDTRVFAKVCHLAIGIDLLGSATSLSTGRGRTLEVTPIGIKAHSEKSGRTVVIPYSNIKGFELL
jgi:hypothetical protein